MAIELHMVKLTVDLSKEDKDKQPFSLTACVTSVFDGETEPRNDSRTVLAAPPATEDALTSVPLFVDSET